MPTAADSLEDKPAAARFVRTETVKVDAKELGTSFWEDVEKAAHNFPGDGEVEALANQLAAALVDGAKPLLAFDHGTGEKFVRVDGEQGGRRFWIVGDLHGDILGLETVLGYLKARHPEHEATVVFLGDLFDRGEHGAAVLYRVLRLIVQAPGTHGFIIGNHDEGLRYDKDANSFSSDVQPSEFVDWLNEKPEGSAWRQLAKAAIEFFRRVPRALLLPDGLLIAHGGVPHVDLQPRIEKQENLEEPNLLQDFVWTRLHESAKRKIPNRTTRGCSLGVSDFDAFCARMEGIDLPVKGIVRGHDHLEARHAFLDKYEQHPVLTINTICYRQAGETFGEFQRPAVVAERSSGAMPVVHALEVPRELIEKFYGAEVPPAS